MPGAWARTQQNYADLHQSVQDCSHSEASFDHVEQWLGQVQQHHEPLGFEASVYIEGI